MSTATGDQPRSGPPVRATNAALDLVALAASVGGPMALSHLLSAPRLTFRRPKWLPPFVESGEFNRPGQTSVNLLHQPPRTPVIPEMLGYAKTGSVSDTGKRIAASVCQYQALCAG